MLQSRLTHQQQAGQDVEAAEVQQAALPARLCLFALHEMLILQRLHALLRVR